MNTCETSEKGQSIAMKKNHEYVIINIECRIYICRKGSAVAIAISARNTVRYFKC